MQRALAGWRYSPGSIRNFRRIGERACSPGAAGSFYAQGSFADAGLREHTIAQLARAGIERPSMIQLQVCAAGPKVRPVGGVTDHAAQAIPAVLRGDDTIISAETGSGKTISYLAPILDAISPGEAPEGPRALVLAPTRELVSQIRGVALSLRDDLAKLVVPAWGAHRVNVNLPCAVLVATPQAAAEHLQRAPAFFAGLRTLVIDEADLLLSASYSDSTTKALRQARRSAAQPIATVLAAATLPSAGARSPGAWIQRHLPRAVHCATDLLHRVKPTVAQAFVTLGDHPGLDEDNALLHRLRTLLAVLDADACSRLAHSTAEPPSVAAIDLGVLPTTAPSSGSGGGISRPGSPFDVLSPTSAARRDTAGTLVFANTARTAQRVAAALRHCGFRTGAIHKKVSGKQRDEELRAFGAGETQMLVATDVASRGLDLPGVEHVIQLEFALDVTSHLHRVGRTARADAHGRATHIVGPENALLLGALQSEALLGAEDVSSLFSRKRRLRNKLRHGKLGNFAALRQ